MANPQIENGFTRIANEIMDALSRIRISGEAVQVLFLILRKTYGFQKKTDLISLSQFCQGTGLPKVAVCKALTKLRSMEVITKKGNAITQLGNGWCSEYGLNKDCEEWKPLPKKVTLPKKVMSITKKGNETLPKKTPTKETIKRKKERADTVFPLSLDSQKFRDAWTMWGKFRDEIKKPLSPIGERMALKKLAEFPVEVAIKTVENSIANQWQGLFPEKVPSQQPSSPEELREFGGINVPK